MCVGPQRKTTVCVAEVVRQLFDRDALRQQGRGVEVPKRVHAVRTIDVDQVRRGERGLPVSVVELGPGVHPAGSGGDQQPDGDRVSGCLAPGQCDHYRRM